TTGAATQKCDIVPLLLRHTDLTLPSLLAAHHGRDRWPRTHCGPIRAPGGVRACGTRWNRARSTSSHHLSSSTHAKAAQTALSIAGEQMNPSLDGYEIHRNSLSE